MDYLNQIASQYEGLFSVLGSIFGIAGFLFGAWRYFREQKAQEKLEDKQLELDQALSRLKHLDDFASDLKQYPKTG